MILDNLIFELICLKKPEGTIIDSILVRHLFNEF